MRDEVTKMSAVIETQNLKKRYRMGNLDVSALSGVNMRVEKGEFMSIMGPSGSGKTTLLNLIGALDRPTEGKVLIKGTDISKLSDDELAELRNREIGFVFQFFKGIVSDIFLHRICGAKSSGAYPNPRIALRPLAPFSKTVYFLGSFLFFFLMS